MIPSPDKADHKNLFIEEIHGETWYRISDPNYPSPLYFNPDQTGRWNSPDGQFGVCYVARSVDAAFAETYGRGIMAAYSPGSPKIISEAALRSKHVYEINSNIPLRIAHFFGKGLARLNLDNSINTTTNYSQVQCWSAWVRNLALRIDAIEYQSRHLSDTTCLALFDHTEFELGYQDMGSMDDWKCTDTGRDIYDILEDQGWLIS